MGELIAKREIEVITEEIITIRENTNRMVLESSIEIGRRLLEAKEIVGHGGWGEYLREKVSFSPSRANNLMRIYQAYGDDQLELGKPSKSHTYGNLSYSKAVALLALPEPDREEIVAEHDMESTSVRELQAIIEEKKREAEAARAEATKYEEALINQEKELDDAKKDAEEARRKLNETGKFLEKRDMELIAAEERIKTLEARPVEVAVQPPSEEQLKAIRKDAEKEAKEKYKKKETEFKERMADLKRELTESRQSTERQTARTAELEKKLAVAGNSGTVEFNLLFRRIQEDLDKLHRKYLSIQSEDPEMGSRMRLAMIKFTQMLEKKWTE